MAAVIKQKLELLLPRFKPGNPVSLTGSVNLNPGSTLPLNLDALRNPSKLPLAIHEIKFVSTTVVQVVSVDFFADGTSGYAPPTSASVLEASLTMEKHQITRGPTPVNLIGVRRSAVTEVLGRTSGGGSNFGVANQVWRLSSPIILKGGQALSISLGHRGFFPFPVTAYATISGKFLASMPRSMHVPYIAPFVPAAFLPDSGTSDTLVRTSTERDLANELKVPLKVQRFIGKISATSNGNALFDLAAVTNSLLATVSMRSASGVPTVRNDTPFENVFDAHSGSWECPHEMPPGAYWIATLKSAGTSVDQGAQIMPGIALHGTREVRT